MEAITKRSIASLAIKLMGLYVITYALRTLPSVIHVLGEAERILERGGEGSGLLALLMVGARVSSLGLFFTAGPVAIAKADSFARRVVREDEAVVQIYRLSVVSVLKIIVFGMGVSLLLSSIPRTYGAYLIYSNLEKPSDLYLFTNSLIPLVSLVFILRPGWIVRLIVGENFLKGDGQ